jgi:nitroimidazol reductase NimA-like FMN-containing flavoprotein (pyridoxamine 5'-phosphate oxidase superfamily)
MTSQRDMTEQECRQRLHAVSGGVGRLAVATPDGPMVWPVNFAFDGDAVFFRTSAHGELGRLEWGVDVAFEIDHIDERTREGWSVVVRGQAHIIDDPEEEDRLRSIGREPKPWADGLRRLYIQIPCRHITGKVVGRDWTPVADHGLPAHHWLG